MATEPKCRKMGIFWNFVKALFYHGGYIFGCLLYFKNLAGKYLLKNICSKDWESKKLSILKSSDGGLQ